MPIPQENLIFVEQASCLLSSRTQLITQNSRLQALSSKESAKNQCVINSVQLLIRGVEQADSSEYLDALFDELQSLPNC